MVVRYRVILLHSNQANKNPLSIILNMSLSEDPNNEPPSNLVPYSEVAKHNSNGDLWCIIGTSIYDFTDFAPEHPGGAAVVTELAGQNATKDFLHAHPIDIMTLTLGKKGLAKAYRGEVDPSTLPLEEIKTAASSKKEKEAKTTFTSLKDLGPNEAPPLEAVLNLHDFEAIAQRVMVHTGKKEAWDYYSSGADDELTYNENVSAFQRIWLKPRILVDVKHVDTSCTILGSPSSAPVYLSAVAMCGIGHVDGECAWARAAGNEDTIFMVPNLNSKGFSNIVQARTKKNQPLWFQIYVNPDRDVVLDQMRDCEAAGITALCITVDSAVAGKRERDLRNKLERQIDNQRKKDASDAAAAAASLAAGGPASSSINKGGTSKRKAGSYANRDPALNWDDVSWFQQNTTMKIVIKGVQTGLDAIKAAQAGCHAIILSNHGGRNLDTSRSGIEVLPEVMRDLKEAGLEGKIDVFVDGGIRRGTDVLKCIALGAKAVGLGKPAVYSMSAYGQVGIERMLQILKEELVLGMRLCGVTKLEELTPAHVNALDLERHGGAFTPIPPSPYAYSAPQLGVRSPPFPEGEKTRDELVRNIEDLQKQLLIAEGKTSRRNGCWCSGSEKDDGGEGEGSLGGQLFPLSRVMVVSLLQTTFAKTAGGMLHRSALFLIFFLALQAIVGVSVVLGPDWSNAFLHSLTSTTLWRFFEWYLLVTTLVHLGTAGYFTMNRRKYIAKAPIQNGKLALTGTVLTAFLGLHFFKGTIGVVLPILSNFRLPGQGGVMTTVPRDMWSLQKELFSHPMQIALYMVALFSVGVHLWQGWRKAVLKMDIGKKSREPFTTLGHLLIWPLLGALAVAPCFFFLFAGSAPIAKIVSTEL